LCGELSFEVNKAVLPEGFHRAQFYPRREVIHRAGLP
jgi:hypothetical protein